jgi:hypothetical protein
MRECYDLYVGRGNDPRSGEPGEWGNPYSHRPSRVPGVILVATVEEAVAMHKRWIWEQIRSGRLPLERLAALDGLTLGCWCNRPAPCHGWTLKLAAAWAAEQLALARSPAGER